MPIYEYRCASCGHTLEVIQKRGAKPPRKCTECSGTLKKLISRSAFTLKGGGWYNEGYGSDGKASSASSTPPASTASDSGTKPGEAGGAKPENGKKASAGGCGPGACGCH